MRKGKYKEVQKSIVDYEDCESMLAKFKHLNITNVYNMNNVKSRNYFEIPVPWVSIIKNWVVTHLQNMLKDLDADVQKTISPYILSSVDFTLPEGIYFAYNIGESTEPLFCSFSVGNIKEQINTEYDHDLKYEFRIFFYDIKTQKMTEVSSHV